MSNIASSARQICRQCHRRIDRIASRTCQRAAHTLSTNPLTTDSSATDPSRRATTFDPGPSSVSVIFDEQLDYSPRTKTRQRARREAFNRDWTASKSPEEVLEKQRWEADPWHKISRSPARQCQITRQKLPNDLLVNFRRALYDPQSPGDPTRSKNQFEAYVVPDRVSHPRFAPPKTGSGFWTLCHRAVVARSPDPGPHSRFIGGQKAQVIPNIESLVYLQLCERIVQELQLLHSRIRSRTFRVGTRLKARDGISGDDIPMQETPVMSREVTVAEAEGARAGRFEDVDCVALFDLSGHLPEAAKVGKANDPDAGTGEGAIPIPTASTRSVKTPTREIPSYVLSDLLPAQLQGQARHYITQILASEGLEKQRNSPEGPQGTAKMKQAGSSEVKPSSDSLASSTYPRSAGGARKGDVGLDLAVACWRLRCFLGEGWAESDVDRMGRKV